MENEIILNAPFGLVMLVSALVGAAAGFVGSFMVLRRLALVGDVLTHVALPGMALAILYKLNPFLGALIFLLFAVLGIWWLQHKTTIPPDALVGLFFTGALALGILIFPDTENVLEALFGDITKITARQGILAAIFSLAALIFAYALHRKMILITLSEDIAKTSGVRVGLVHLLFLMLVALVVSLGISFVGTLLMGALVIIPAAAARNISGNFKQYMFWSALIGCLAGGVGIFLANNFKLIPGPIVVLVGLGIFFLTLLTRLFKKLE